MHPSNSSETEKLNCLAAALLAAAGIHVLLSALSIPSLLALGTTGLGEMAVKSLKIAWTVAGIVGGLAVAFHALYLINGRSYTKARLAAIGTLLLPLLGVSGMITAFPLVPAGIVALFLLLSPKWKAAFREEWQQEESRVSVEA